MLQFWRDRPLGPRLRILAGLVPMLVLAACASEPPRQPMARQPAANPALAVPQPVGRPWTAETVPAPTITQPQASRALQAGLASFYWQDQMTASGERFDRRALTAAHRTLPLGTRVKVTHAVSGRSVVVRINDRGPFKPGRIIDLSEAAAEAIAMTRAGLAQVTLDVVP